MTIIGGPTRGLRHVAFVHLPYQVISSVQLTRSHFISHNFFANERKIIYAACSIPVGRFSIGRVMSSGEERGLLSRSVADNRAYAHAELNPFSLWE